MALVRSGVRYWPEWDLAKFQVITGLGPGGNASEAEAMMGTDGFNR